MLEQDEFFNAFQKKGLTFQEWLDTIENEKNKKMIQKHFNQSVYLKEELKTEQTAIHYKIYILAVVAEWCGDCHRNIPILTHMAEITPKIELRLLIKEKNLEFISTTNGGEKIPFVLFYGQDGFHITTWVERPMIAYRKLAELYQQIGFEEKTKIAEGWRTIFTEHQKEFYQAAAKEILEIINRVNVIQGTSRRINTAR